MADRNTKDTERRTEAAKDIMRFVMNNLHDGYGMFDGWSPFEEILKKHWIIPADDDEPIDEAWLASVGFVLFYGRWRLAGCFIVPRDEGFYVSLSDNSTKVATRGSVRRLCDALSITLQEST